MWESQRIVVVTSVSWSTVLEGAGGLLLLVLLLQQ